MILLGNLAFSDQIGIASHYSVKTNHGTRTASGEKLRDDRMTVAHRSLKFGTKVKVTNLKNGKSVVLTCTDRGPYVKNRIIDVSQAAAKALGFQKQGLTKVKVSVVSPENPKKAVVVEKKVSWMSSIKTRLQSLYE